MSTRRKPLRFVLIGVLNTAIDFGVLFGLTAIGLAIVPANMLSTAAALTFSFIANRSFTFGVTGNALAQAAKFLVVTLIGLWGLQPLILLGGSALLGAAIGAGPALLVAKIAATVVSMVWNYLLYDRFVFRTPAPRDGRNGRGDRTHRHDGSEPTDRDDRPGNASTTRTDPTRDPARRAT